MPKLIALEIDGETLVHARGDSNYVSLCGLDGGLSGLEFGREVSLPPGAKIDCFQCKNAFLHWKRYTIRDFVQK